MLPPRPGPCSSRISRRRIGSSHRTTGERGRATRHRAHIRRASSPATLSPCSMAAAGFVGQVDAALSHDARDRLGAVVAPTLVIHGAVDQLSPKENGEELSRLIRGAELLIVPDAGHAVNLEGQRTVNAALRALWKRVP